jgi:hypothetical protein
MYMLVNLMQGVEGLAPAGAEGSTAAAAAAAAAAADGSASAPARLGLTLTVSMLGYCLLPIVLLAALAVFFNLHGLHGMVLGVAAILWSTLSCARFFEVALRMSDRKWLIAYPAGLFYACFALMVRGLCVRIRVVLVCRLLRADSYALPTAPAPPPAARDVQAIF